MSANWGIDDDDWTGFPPNLSWHFHIADPSAEDEDIHHRLELVDIDRGHYLVASITQRDPSEYDEQGPVYYVANILYGPASPCASVQEAVAWLSEAGPLSAHARMALAPSFPDDDLRAVGWSV